MDTQIEVPNFKLAKIGKDREKKRGGGGWLGARGASSGFSGAVGGAGAGAGGLLGSGMSLAKLLTILLVSGMVSAGAWKVGDMMAGSSAADAKSAGPKVFADKDSGKYADTSGVIKNEKSIPNSLGYINNDGLTDEQRAAKKAAEDAAAAKAASDAQAKADADAKAKALADATAASATPDAAAPVAAAGPEAVAKKGLSSGKFGSLGSSLGGGGGLSGGAGLSGGINGKFAGMGGLGDKANKGAISAFRSPTKAASSSATPAKHGHSNAKGFARQQLDQAFGQSRSALATGKSESASAGAGAPFDNNGAQGSVISGPGLGSGTQTGAADSGNANNPSTGGGPTSNGGGAACSDSNFQPDINGNCTLSTNTPTAKNSCPYQGLLDAIMIMMGIVMILSIIAMAVKNVPPYGTGIALALCAIACGLGVAIAGMGIAIATMKHGDFMIGGIVAVVGGFIATAAAVSFGHATSAIPLVLQPAGVLIASALGELAAMSGKSKAAAMQ